VCKPKVKERRMTESRETTRSRCTSYCWGWNFCPFSIVGGSVVYFFGAFFCFLLVCEFSICVLLASCTISSSPSVIPFCATGMLFSIFLPVPFRPLLSYTYERWHLDSKLSMCKRRLHKIRLNQCWACSSGTELLRLR
jgi:hypothetical protein